MSKAVVPADPADRPLTKRQRQIVDHILTTGERIAVAAKSLGTAETNIYRTLRKPHVRAYLQKRTQEHIGILASYAARVQGELLASDSDHVRASVSQNILDRHLGKAVERKQVAIGGSIDVRIDLS